MIIQKLQQMKNMTHQEKLIADYILKNPESILSMNAKELSGTLYTSSSTIVRFCKKIGFSGYPQFQLQFIREYGTRTQYGDFIQNSNIKSNNAPNIFVPPRSIPI